MKESQWSEYEGYLYGLIGVFFYILFKIYPVFNTFRIAATFALLFAAWQLFDSMKIAKKEQASQKFQSFQKIKNDLEKEYKEKLNGSGSDSKTEIKKSEDDADLK
jgi:hypothetical protein